MKMPFLIRQFFLKMVLFIYLRERASACVHVGGWAEEEGEGQADSILSADPKSHDPEIMT